MKNLVLFFGFICIFTNTYVYSQSRAGEISPASSFDSILNQTTLDMITEISPVNKPNIGVTGFLLDGTEAGISSYVIDKLSEIFISSRKFRVIERSNIETVMKEQNFQLSGNVNDESAKGIGKIIGVDYLCYGAVNVLGDKLKITTKVVNVETGEIVTLRNKTIDISNDTRSLLSKKRMQDSTGLIQNNSVATGTETISAVPKDEFLAQLNNEAVLKEEQIKLIKEAAQNVEDNLCTVAITGTKQTTLTRKERGSGDRPTIVTPTYEVNYSIKYNWNVIKSVAKNFETIKNMNSGNSFYTLQYFESPYSNKLAKIPCKIEADALKLWPRSVYWEIVFDWIDINDDLILSKSERATLDQGGGLGDSDKNRSFIFEVSGDTAFKNSKDIRIREIWLRNGNDTRIRKIYSYE